MGSEEALKKEFETEVTYGSYDVKQAMTYTGIHILDQADVEFELIEFIEVYGCHRHSLLFLKLVKLVPKKLLQSRVSHRVADRPHRAAKQTAKAERRRIARSCVERTRRRRRDEPVFLARVIELILILRNFIFGLVIAGFIIRLLRRVVRWELLVVKPLDARRDGHQHLLNLFVAASLLLHFLLKLPEPSSKVFWRVLAENCDNVFGRVLESCDSRLHRFVGARSDGALCAKKERRDTRESRVESREKSVSRT